MTFGYPNIIGTTDSIYRLKPSATPITNTGAFYSVFGGSSTNQAQNYDGGIGFNANSSNSIYTDSGKVYPLSLALNFIIKT